MDTIIYDKSNDNTMDEYIIPVRNILYIRKFMNVLQNNESHQIEIHLINGEKFIERYSTFEEFEKRYFELKKYLDK